jgi:PRTRC genetic system protein B
MTTTTITRRRPTVKRRPPSRNVAIPEAPDMILSIYRQGRVLLDRPITPDGKIWQSYLVSPKAVASVLQQLPSAPSYLPPNIVASGETHGQPLLVLYRPASVQTLVVRSVSGVATYTIPLPPLVWFGCGTEYRIAALDTTAWPNAKTPLMVAPFPNVYRNSSICWGSSDQQPQASAETIGAALDLFLTGSEFSGHVTGARSKQFASNILLQWAQLHAAQAETYPLDDLVPLEATLGEWIEGRNLR